jgi:hypothetical protein
VVRTLTRILHQAAQNFPIGPPQWKFFAATKEHHSFAAATALYFRDGVKIDDKRSVNADELFRRKSLLKIADLIARQKDTLSSGDSKIICRRFNPFDFRVPQENDLAVDTNHKTFSIAGDLAKEREESLAVTRIRSLRNRFLGPGKRFRETILLGIRKRIADADAASWSVLPQT